MLLSLEIELHQESMLVRWCAKLDESRLWLTGVIGFESGLVIIAVVMLLLLLLLAVELELEAGKHERGGWGRVSFKRLGRR